MSFSFPHAIIVTGKRNECVHVDTKRKPTSGNSWVFLSNYLKWQDQTIQAYYRFVLLLIIKPFAYVVGDHTCHNGKEKRNE